MEIKYTGEYISQYNLLKKDFEKLLNTAGEKERENILNIVSGKDKKSKLKSYKYLRDVGFENIQTIFNYSQIFNSYNKNKGQWLEDILKYVFERTNLFNKKNSVTWEKDIILEYLPVRDFRIDRKLIKAYTPIKLQDLSIVKKISFNCSNMSYCNNKIISYFEDNNLSHLIESIVFRNNLLTKDFFDCEITFKKSLKLSYPFFSLLISLGLFYRKSLIELKTDVTIEDKKNKNIFIVECKNTEYSGVKLEHIAKTVFYAVREKEFSNNKFKKIYIAYRGDIEEKILKSLERINKNFKSYCGAELHLIKFEEFLDILKENYFDDENKNKYIKKNITCWDFDTLRYVEAESHEPRKYSPLFELNGIKDTLLINLDYNFKFREHSKIVEGWEKNFIKNQDEDKTLKELGGQLIKNE